MFLLFLSCFDFVFPEALLFGATFWTPESSAAFQFNEQLLDWVSSSKLMTAVSCFCSTIAPAHLLSSTASQWFPTSFSNLSKASNARPRCWQSLVFFSTKWAKNITMSWERLLQVERTGFHSNPKNLTLVSDKKLPGSQNCSISWMDMMFLLTSIRQSFMSCNSNHIFKTFLFSSLFSSSSNLSPICFSSFKYFITRPCLKQLSLKWISWEIN